MTSAYRLFNRDGKDITPKGVVSDMTDIIEEQVARGEFPPNKLHESHVHFQRDNRAITIILVYAISLTYWLYIHILSYAITEECMIILYFVELKH